MEGKRTSLIILTLVFTILIASLVPAVVSGKIQSENSQTKNVDFDTINNDLKYSANNSSDWNQFGNDSQNSGVGNQMSGPITNVGTGWDVNLGDLIRYSPVTNNGVAYVGSSENSSEAYVNAVDLANGELIWRTQLPNSTDAVYTPAVQGGVVYVGAQDDADGLFALDASSGDILWSVNDKYGVNSPTIYQDRVYVRNDTGRIYSIKKSDGSIAWEQTVGSDKSRGMAVSDGLLLAGEAGFSPHSLWAVDASNGEVLWNFSSDGRIRAQPTIANESAYFATYNGSVYSLNIPTNGTLEWKFNTTSSISSSPAVYNGSIYFATTDGTIYAANTSNGQKEWTFSANDGIGSSPSVSNGTVYIGSDDGYLYAIDASTGELEWKTKTGVASEISPAIDGDSVVMASLDGQLTSISESPAEIELEKSNITLKPGEEFSIDIQASSLYGTSNDIYGTQFRLSYDPSLISAVNISSGSYLGSNTIVGQKEINNTAGRIDYGEATSDSTGVSGNGTLASATFEVSNNVPNGTDTNLTFPIRKISDQDGKAIQTIGGDTNVLIATIGPSVDLSLYSTTNHVGSPLKISTNITDSDGDISSITAVYPNGTSKSLPLSCKQAAPCEESLTPSQSTWDSSKGEYKSKKYTIQATDSDGNIQSQSISLTVCVAGDANCDGIVDIYDLVGVTQRLENSRGDSSYTNKYDLNNDDVIDIQDAAIIGKNWQDRPI